MDRIETARLDRDALFGLEAEKDIGARSLSVAARPLAGRMFTPFIEQDLRNAATLAEKLAAQVDAQTGVDDATRLADVMSTARALAQSGDPRMVQHAIGLFLTHHPLGRKLPVPSLLKRTARTAIKAAAVEETLDSHSDGEEIALDWFREDPLLNEHHEHWHWVYPNRSGDGSLFKVKERHGELFYYMHQQMLARYDAERIALGLQKVAPISDYTAPLGAGYSPGRLSEYGFGTRENDSVMVALEGFSPTDLQGHRERLELGIAEKHLINAAGQPVPLEGHLGSNILGLTSESTEASVNGAAYGNHHGMGHGLIGDRAGVMLATETAIRDPAFWRWHRHIDDLNFGYQESLPPHDFSDRPPVRLVKTAFGFERDHPGNEKEGADLTEIAQQVLATGGVERLETSMRTGTYQLLTGNRYRFDYLSHAPFFIATELHNDTAAPKAVTLRFFLLPEALVDVNADPTTIAGCQMRRFVIELDKVRVRIAPGQQVFARAGRQMSVIRRPAVLDPTDVIDLDGSTLDVDARTCTCGWPFGLLLPRGTKDGMPFTLFVMATDNDKDKVGSQKKCGSMSFCGVGDEYPDARPMGYPFDRPLERPLSAIVADNPNMLLRPVTVRWLGSP